MPGRLTEFPAGPYGWMERSLPRRPVLRRPPWLTAATEESRVRTKGTMPLERPLVPRISEPRERMRL
ncbi:hypothetical protein Sm713_07960 [Streptomyces sp. TS71-3]|nr:hypothetical protein Sm713_07960 [Streptomyces sp. TS71-3]